MNNDNTVLNMDFFNEDKPEREFLPLNLQFFAEGDDKDDKDDDKDDDKNKDDPDTDKDTDKDDKEATYSQSDVDSAVSKAVDKALKKKREEFEKEKQKAVEDAKKDAQDYAKMTKSEKEEADYKKRMKELEDRERELNLKQLRAEVEGDLKEEGLPADFAESLVNLEDNEKIKESISNIKKTFDDAVNNAVKEKLRQDPPEASNSKIKNNNLNKTKAEMAKKNRIIK
ncbi:DUF4355 domain-containing protein [Alkalibacillus salilacus]|uniref:DUF4355 domain-containing protein n=1 Tax=Alkalibacillus salilacus TaxID=284582 RepID=A0ABT9VCW2_9BACI|nr:DUF4355 domain-containing protein [Alkalibacillus salilacus]MDQ0158812.1 hypothetical protein [Alkalibacillus salilacus]